MSRLFLDTSALIKLYRNEPNSPVVRACVSPSDELIISQITPLEYRSAFAGLVRQNLMSKEEISWYIDSFERDRNLYLTVPASEKVFNRAEALLETWAISEGLRPLGALQLASTLEVHGRNALDALVTTDATLATVSRAVGLAVRP